ncbi:MAG: ANTAR domain-containing protein [Moraxellaceae bacterium]|nr:ANTAR domain-containing protein [Moraxellaceae bacterium]
MLKVLVIDELGSRARELCEGLAEAGYGVSAILRDMASVADSIRDHDADLILVHTDSPRPDGLAQLAALQHATPRPVLMFATDSSETAIRAAMRAGASAYIVDGLYVERLAVLVRVSMARFDEHQSLKRERDDAARKLSERVTIERAKGVLMKARGLDEDEAYHSLRRLAMERGKRLGDVANDVLATADLLLGRAG